MKMPIDMDSNVAGKIPFVLPEILDSPLTETWKTIVHRGKNSGVYCQSAIGGSISTPTSHSDGTPEFCSLQRDNTVDGTRGVPRRTGTAGM